MDGNKNVILDLTYPLETQKYIIANITLIFIP